MMQTICGVVLEYASPVGVDPCHRQCAVELLRKLEAKENAQREKYAIESLLNVDDDLSLHILDTSYQKFFATGNLF